MDFINKRKIFFVAIIFVTASTLIGAGTNTKVIIPKNARSPVIIEISEKNLKYYSISPDEATILSVRGPGKLKIITRGQLNSRNKTPLNYIIYYRINGGQKNNVEFSNVKADDNASFKDASVGFPSVGENIIVELARGENTVEVWSDSSNPKIYIRSLFTEIKEKKIDWIKLSPAYPNEPVNLITNENVSTYYRYSNTKSLEIKITGPTVLRILNRFEFDYKMKGKISYRIEVKEDKKLKNTYMLCADRSDVTRYRNNGKNIPGKANEIVINVPTGTHKYNLIPLDNCTVLGKILFPKKDIKLEEK